MSRPASLPASSLPVQPTNTAVREAAPIAKAEPANSTVLPDETPGKYLPLVEGVVVLARDVPDSWGQGKPQAGPKRPAWVQGQEDITYRRLRREKLPAELLGWQGRNVRLFSTSGAACQATIIALWPGSALRTDGSLATDGATGEQVSERQQLDEGWRIGRKLLVGELRVTQGDCKGARFARAAELPLPPMAKFEPAEPPWRAVAQRQFQAHPLYAKMQARWLELLDQKGLDPALPSGRTGKDNQERPHWLQQRWDGPNQPLAEWPGKVFVARHPLRAGTLLSVTGVTWTDNEQLFGTMWALWQATGAPPAPNVELLNQPAHSQSPEPLAALDLDGDGRLEFLSEYGVLAASTKEPQAYTIRDFLDLPEVYGCGQGGERWDLELGGVHHKN